MSLLISVTPQPNGDGFTIVTTALGSITITSADLSQKLINQGAAAVQALVNNQLSTKFGAGPFFFVTIQSLVPLVVQIYDSNYPILAAPPPRGT